MMKSKYTAYTEAVYKEKDDGSCHWLGRVYNRVGPAKVLETHDGIAPSRDAAIAAVREWSDTILNDKYNDSEDLQVITTDDIEVVD